MQPSRTRMKLLPRGARKASGAGGGASEGGAGGGVSKPHACAGVPLLDDERAQIAPRAQTPRRQPNQHAVDAAEAAGAAAAARSI